MNSSLVYLVGGFHEVVELLEDLDIEIIGLVDRNKPSCPVCQKYRYLGDDNWLCDKGPEMEMDTVLITPDQPEVREQLSVRYQEAGFKLAKVVCEKPSPSSRISDGVIVQRLSYISSGCHLRKGVKINIGVRVMHDVLIGEFSTVAPAAVLLGGVTIGKRVFIGANATILPGISVGDDAVVGAGAVVTRDISSGSRVAGVPARNLGN